MKQSADNGRASCEDASHPIRTKLINGLQVVVLPPNSPRIDAERIKSLLDEEL